MHKLFKNFLQITLLTALMLSAVHITTFAASNDSLADLLIPDAAKHLFEIAKIPAPPQEAGQTIFKNLILEGLKYVKIIIGVVGILYLTILGYILLTASDNEENVTQAKRGIIYTFIAFMMISMSEDVGKIFDMQRGTLLGSPHEILRRVRLFDKQLEIAITFIKYLIGTFATIMVIRSGMKLISSGGNEEEAATHKKSILYSGGGLLVLLIGEIFIDKVFYKIDTSVYTGITGAHPYMDAKAGIEQIAGITNFIAGLVGPLAVLILLIGGILYATAGGEEEKMETAKRLIVATGFGIILIYGAFALVSTVIAGKLNDISAITT